MSYNPDSYKEVDFRVMKEDFGRYDLSDGTLLKIKAVVHKMLRSVDINPVGYPDVAIDSSSVVTAIVPDALKGSPSAPFDIDKERPEEVQFTPQDVLLQEYLMDGFMVSVQPALTKVFKYNKFNARGEPVYGTVIQPILNIDVVDAPPASR